MRRDGFPARGDILWVDGIQAGFTAKEGRRNFGRSRRACLRYMLRICNKGWHRVRAYTGYNPPHRRPLFASRFLAFVTTQGPRRRGDDKDDDDKDARLPAAIVIAAENCRSPEAAKHVPLILPPLDDDCLIHEPHLDRRSSPPPSPRRPRRARWPIARTSPHIPRCPSRLSPRPSAPLPSTAYRITATPCPLSTQGHVPARLLITSVASTRHPLRRSPLASPSRSGTLGRGRLRRHQLHLPIGRDSAFHVPPLPSFTSLTLSFSHLQTVVTDHDQGKVGAGSR